LPTVRTYRCQVNLGSDVQSGKDDFTPTFRGHCGLPSVSCRPSVEVRPRGHLSVGVVGVVLALPKGQGTLGAPPPLVIGAVFMVPTRPIARQECDRDSRTTGALTRMMVCARSLVAFWPGSKPPYVNRDTCPQPTELVGKHATHFGSWNPYCSQVLPNLLEAIDRLNEAFRTRDITDRFIGLAEFGKRGEFDCPELQELRPLLWPIARDDHRSFVLRS